MFSRNLWVSFQQPSPWWAPPCVQLCLCCNGEGGEEGIQTDQNGLRAHANFLLQGSLESCPLSQPCLPVRGYISLLCSRSSSVTIFCYGIFWLLAEALIPNAAINGCAPFPLGCSFFNPRCLPQCHLFPFFFYRISGLLYLLIT